MGNALVDPKTQIVDNLYSIRAGVSYIGEIADVVRQKQSRIDALAANNTANQNKINTNNNKNIPYNANLQANLEKQLQTKKTELSENEEKRKTVFSFVLLSLIG